MLLKICRIALLFVLVPVMACKETKVSEIKDYRLYVESDDSELKAAIRDLVDQYNTDVGSKALTLVETQEEANSNITFVENLTHEHSSKLGLGQWIAHEEAKNNMSLMGTQTKITIRRSMALEFDLENFKSKLAAVQGDKNSDAYKHLYHLFCHEVGHGLELDHTNAMSSVMYKSIPDHYTRTIDYSSYFAYVRDYMNVDTTSPY